MDLFGTKRRNATNAAVNAARPLIGTIQHLYGIPVGFWQDEFVLGYMMSLGSTVINTFDDGFSTETKGKILTDFFTSISNQNGQAISRKIVDLNSHKTPDYIVGGDNAMLSLFYSVGSLKNEDTFPEIVQAKLMAFELGHGQDKGAIGAILIQKLFHRVVIERFQLG